MNREEPMPIESEDARTLQPATLRDEHLEREQEMARRDNGHEQRVEESRTADVRPGDEREVRMEQDPIHGEGMSQSELSGYRDRFADLQARFIDDPKGATDQAGSLLKEAVDRLMESMSKGGDTERMRLGMQRYRNALETIVDQTRV